MSRNEQQRKKYAQWKIDCEIHQRIHRLRDRKRRVGFHQLVTNLRSKSNLLSVQPIGGYPAWTNASRILDGVFALSEHTRYFASTGKIWKPTHENWLEQFHSFAECVFGGHSVPKFFANVWFDPRTSITRQYQRWFRHLAAGHHIRGVDLPQKFTKQMATRFMNANHANSVQEALNFARGNTPKEANKEHFPAGLSRRRSKRCHGWKIVNDPLWKQLPIRNFRYDEPQKHAWVFQYWTIRQLRSWSELLDEGDALHHCVANYGDRCESGETSIWSLCSHGLQTRQKILTIQVDPQERMIIQALGKCNRYPKKEVRSIMERWAEQESLKIARWVK